MLKRSLPCLLLIVVAFSGFSRQPKPAMTVYACDSFANEWGPGPAVKQAFEAECDCTVKFIKFSDGIVLLNRLRMEGSSSPADVALCLDNNLMQAAQQTDLFASSNIDTSQLLLPIPWINKTFIPYDYGYFSFIYNKDKLNTPPASLHDLINSTQPWKIIYQDPRSSTPGLGLLLWMKQVYGEQAAVAWQKLAKKTVTVTQGWSEAYGLFLQGEADLVLSYTTSPAWHVEKEHNSQYAAAEFTDGHYLQIEVAARLKSSKLPELSSRFMQFLLTAAFQQNIPLGNWMYPVIKVTLPASFSHLIKPQKVLKYSAEEVAQNRSKWIQEWQNAVSR